MIHSISEHTQDVHPTLLAHCQTLQALSVWGAYCFAPVSIAFTHMCLGLLLGTYLLEIILTRKLSLPLRSSFHRALFAYILLTIVLAPFAVNARKSIVSLTNLADIGIFFLLYLALREKTQIKRAIHILMISITICAAYGIIQHYLEVDVFHFGRPISFLKHLNDDLKAPVRIAGFSSYMTFAGQLGMALPVLTAYALCSANRNVRSRWIAALLVCGIALVWTYTRSAWLGALLALIVIGYIQKGTRVLIPVFFLFLLFAGMVFAQQHREKQREEQVEQYRQRWTEETSSGAQSQPENPAASPRASSRFIDRFASIFSTNENQERLYTWISSLRMVKDHLFTGIGHGNYSTLCQQYRTPYQDFTFTSRAHAHNNLLQVAVVGGIPLLACFVWVWVVLFRSLYCAYQESKRAEADVQAITLGVFGAAVAFFAQGMFEYNFGDSEVVTMLWLLTACALRLREFSVPKLS